MLKCFFLFIINHHIYHIYHINILKFKIIQNNGLPLFLPLLPFFFFRRLIISLIDDYLCSE